MNSKPQVSINVDSVSICSGNSVTLTASGATTYTWSPATGLNATNTASVIAAPSATTSYIVSGTTNGCTASDTVKVKVSPSVTPAITVTATTCASNSITYTAVTSNGGQSGVVQWFVNNSLVSTGSAYTLTNAVNGTQVYAKLNSTEPCASVPVVTSQVFTVNCITTGIPAIENTDRLDVVPNPASRVAQLKLELRKTEKVNLGILNNAGICIRGMQFIGKAGRSTTILDFQGLPAGIYYIAVTISGKTEMRKILVLD
jgi:hypothetical protein